MTRRIALAMVCRKPNNDTRIPDFKKNEKKLLFFATNFAQDTEICMSAKKCRKVCRK